MAPLRILLFLTLASLLLAGVAAPAQHAEPASPSAAAVHGAEEHRAEAPGLVTVLPFVTLLLAIAILPLIHRTEHWWEHNSSKLMVALALALVTCLYYLLRGTGFGHGEAASAPGWPALMTVLEHAIIGDYIPFIVLLFSLYTISGGINLRGDLPAHPLTNTLFLAAGTVLASLIGTTGAAMLLIRPLLQVNSERRRVKHTVIFFIFLVANIGGSLLPIGDPPLFLGYLRGVPFLWTLHLWQEWLLCFVVLLVVYYLWDSHEWRHEEVRHRVHDEAVREPLSLRGTQNFVLLLGVVLAVALLVPGRQLFGVTVPMFLREGVQLVLAGVSWAITPRAIRQANRFNFVAIGEVACLFVGIFITMQPAIEILQIKGPELGLTKAWQFFWATGVLSSFLDNAPTYVVYFETAKSLPAAGMAMLDLHHGGAQIALPLLVAVSCGAVFMGANTYIGNGPNFMVKSIAEQSGIKMPTFFGYMAYSGAILLPLFVVITLVFFAG